jgi:hypothetical protein
VSTGNCRLLYLSVTKWRPVVVEQTCAAGDAAASVSLLVVGAGRSTLLRSGSQAAMVPAEGGCGVASGGGSAVRSAIPGTGARISGAGTRVPGAEGKVPEAGAEAVLLGAECRHVAEEVLDLLQKCGVVGGGSTLASAGWVAT